jgi:hypothetical protein
MNNIKTDTNDFADEGHKSDLGRSEEQTQVNLPSYSNSTSALRINELAAAGIAMADGLSSGRDMSPLSLEA